jgi:hypothetical protein
MVFSRIFQPQLRFVWLITFYEVLLKLVSRGRTGSSTRRLDGPGHGWIDLENKDQPCSWLNFHNIIFTYDYMMVYESDDISSCVYNMHHMIL